MATKLTEQEVATAWYVEHPSVVALPSKDDLRKMRGTLLKRAERARKKPFTVDQVRATLGVMAPPAYVESIMLGAPLPPEVQALAEIVAPAPEPIVALGACASFPNDETDPLTAADTRMAVEDDLAPVPAMAEGEEKDPLDAIVEEGLMVADEVAAKEIMPMKRRYIIVPVLSGGSPLPEVTVDAFSEKEANKLVWAGLSYEQRDNCEYLDFVDVQNIPTVLVSANLMVDAVTAANEGAPTNLNAKVDALYAGLDSAPGATATTATKEDGMKKAKKGISTKKAGKRVAREEIVKQAGFTALFEKARKAMRDPERKTCKHGHKISAENAHVGDLKRTGRYTCNPCNDDAQAKYNGAK